MAPRIHTNSNLHEICVGCMLTSRLQFSAKCEDHCVYLEGKKEECLVMSIHCAASCRSLGVTIWELFELGNQPYRHYSDRQVLTYTVREQQLRLPKPLLKVPLAERW